MRKVKQASIQDVRLEAVHEMFIRWLGRQLKSRERAMINKAFAGPNMEKVLELVFSTNPQKTVDINDENQISIEAYLGRIAK